MIKKAKKWLNNRTTYIAAITTALSAVTAWVADELSFAGMVIAILAAITIARARKGTKKTQDGIAEVKVLLEPNQKKE